MEGDSSWQMAVMFSEAENFWELGTQGLLWVDVRCLPNIQGNVKWTLELHV